MRDILGTDGADELLHWLENGQWGTIPKEKCKGEMQYAGILMKVSLMSS